MNQTEAKPEVRIASTPEEKQRIYRFRYDVYVTEMGKQPAGADHQAKTLKDDLDETGLLFFSEHNDEIVATVRLNEGGSAPFHQTWVELYQLDRFLDSFPPESIAMTSRMMVAKEWRGSSVLGGLCAAVYRHGRSRGIRFDFCNCSPFLVDFYEQLGYRRYANGFMEPDTGYHVPMVNLLEDADHLKAIRSPLYRLAGSYESSNETVEWFSKNFSEYGDHINRRLLTSPQFWELLSTKLHTSPEEAIPLLGNLEKEDAQRFLSAGNVLRCRAGETIIKPGDTSNEMYVILSGAAEVLGHADNCRVSLAILGRGQVFGEIGFVSRIRRTAEVEARTDLELLVLSQSFLSKALQKSPEITAQVLLNLSVILCERLQISTRYWMSALDRPEEPAQNRFELDDFPPLTPLTPLEATREQTTVTP